MQQNTDYTVRRTGTQRETYSGCISTWLGLKACTRSSHGDIILHQAKDMHTNGMQQLFQNEIRNTTVRNGSLTPQVCPCRAELRCCGSPVTLLWQSSDIDYITTGCLTPPLPTVRSGGSSCSCDGMHATALAPHSCCPAPLQCKVHRPGHCKAKQTNTFTHTSDRPQTRPHPPSRPPPA